MAITTDLSDSAKHSDSAPKRTAWVWWICILLLLATMINYLDRQALTVVSSRIKSEFELTNEQYGLIESRFGLAFASGLILLGIVADRVSVRWFYPLILALWSLMGFLTGWANSFFTLIICRTLLGFFEGGNWPCGITIIQRYLPRSDRALGNGLLQSGGAIGAILTPLIMLIFLNDSVGSWRPVFQAIGAIGALWIIIWLLSMRGQVLIPSVQVVPKNEQSSLLDRHGSIVAFVFSRRFLVALCVAICCNVTWHMVRVWMPLYLMEGQGIPERMMLAMNAAYFVAADLGCWLAGWAMMWLTRHGYSVPMARRYVYLVCCIASSMSVATLFISGPGVIFILMFVGAGSLGMFPTFYALSQDLTHRNQGVMIGFFGAVPWLMLYYLHPLFGSWVDQSKSYDLGIALVGLLPIVSLVVLWFGWPNEDNGHKNHGSESKT